MAAKIFLVVIMGSAVIGGAILGYNAIGQLPLKGDLMGQILEGCLRAAVVGTAGAIVILLVRRAYQ